MYIESNFSHTYLKIYDDSLTSSYIQ